MQLVRAVRAAIEVAVSARWGSTRISDVITKSAVLQSAPFDRPQLVARVAELEATLASTQTTLARVTAERDKLRRAYEQLQEQLELLRRRIYVAKAERFAREVIPLVG